MVNPGQVIVFDEVNALIILKYLIIMVVYERLYP